MTAKQVYATVAACAVLAYAGAVLNHWAFDDLPIVVNSDLVHSASGWWRAFLSSYWPPELGAYLYRPLTVATYVLDWHLDGAAWFHTTNILWHAAASVLVAMLVRRWVGEAGALVAGVVFAVHPVHVEAVANVIGRAELMAAVFTLLAVYAALERRSVAWTAFCWLLGLLSKESAVVAPVLVAAAWAIGIERPERRKMAAFVASWVVVGVIYLGARESVLRQYPEAFILAPVFIGETWTGARLTAVAALTDVARLLLFPLKLRADYAPNERTIVTTALDARFAAGAVCAVVWSALVALALGRGRKVEALGLIWIALAYALVSNLIVPIGVLIAERTLYLPSAGLALALGGVSRHLRGRALWLVTGALAVAGGVRTALRVPVWRNNLTATFSVLEDSPRSYVGPMIMSAIYLEQHRDSNALRAARIATEIFPREARPYLLGAHAALALRQMALAESLLGRADLFCNPCQGFYEAQATVARRLGDSTVARYLVEHAKHLARP